MNSNRRNHPKVSALSAWDPKTYPTIHYNLFTAPPSALLLYSPASDVAGLAEAVVVLLSWEAAQGSGIQVSLAGQSKCSGSGWSTRGRARWQTDLHLNRWSGVSTNIVHSGWSHFEWKERAGKLTTRESLFPLNAEPKESSKPVAFDSAKLSSPNAAKLLLSAVASKPFLLSSCDCSAGFGFGFCRLGIIY